MSPSNEQVAKKEMIDPGFVPALRDLVHELVERNYRKLEEDGRAGRLTAEELEFALNRYRRRLVDPPGEAFETAKATQISGDKRQWAILLDLWTAEEGQSDLTLEVSLRRMDGGVVVLIDDLHVL